jgi:hypothetical protein
MQPSSSQPRMDSGGMNAFDSIAPMPARLLLSQFLLAHCYASGD